MVKALIGHALRRDGSSLWMLLKSEDPGVTTDSVVGHDVRPIGTWESELEARTSDGF